MSPRRNATVLDVAGLVKRHLGEAPLEIHQLPAFQGDVVRKVVLAGRTVVFKAGHDDWIVSEAHACQLAREAGFPAPEILAAVVEDRPFLIMSQVRGIALSELPLGRWLGPLRRAGELLRALHEIRMDGFGSFARGRPEHARWADALRADWLSALYLLDVDREAYVRVVERHLPNVAEGRLLHGDFVPGHVLVEGDEVTGIIDFGDAMAGDPVWDLARASLSRFPGVLAGLLEGYGPVDGLAPRLALYRMLWSIGMAGTCVRHGIGNVDRHVMAAEGALRELS
jgi:aminoglycoside phosphotransferase (APT) family kinase protein